MIRVTIAVDGDVCEDLVMPAAPSVNDLIAVDHKGRERLYRVLPVRAWVETGNMWLLQLEAEVDAAG